MGKLGELISTRLLPLIKSLKVGVSLDFGNELHS